MTYTNLRTYIEWNTSIVKGVLDLYLPTVLAYLMIDWEWVKSHSVAPTDNVLFSNDKV